MSDTVIIIPSRLNAKRFPNKPLSKINGLPMIVHVMNKAKESDVGEVFVATPDNEIADIVKNNANNLFQEKYSNIADTRLLLEKQVMLQVLDVHWKEHLAEIDHLRQSIGLRAYAQKNPKNEYKREAYAMFEEMLDQINKETIRVLFTLQLTSPDEITNVKDSSQDELELRKDDFNKENINEVNESKLDNIPITREEPKFGRNEVVKITNGIDTKEMKYKKAKLLIETGEWKVI